MNHFIAGIGSNTPDCEEQVASALDMLRKTFQQVRVSETYCTPALAEGQHDYLNAVAVCGTSLSPDVVNQRFKDYERMQGRIGGSSDVKIDIDLVVYDGRILRPRDFQQPYFNRGYRQLLAEGAMQYSVN